MSVLHDVIYQETCCCGGSVTITTAISSHFDRRERINEFVNKHRKCPEVWAGSFPSVSTFLTARSVDPDDSWKLTAEDRAAYGRQAQLFPNEQLVYSLTDVELILREKLNV